MNPFREFTPEEELEQQALKKELKAERIPRGRSTPGLGEPVKICVVKPATNPQTFDHLDPDLGPCFGLGEDYSLCHWPVVIKVKLGISPESVVNALLRVVDSIQEMPAETWEELGRKT